MNNTLHNGFMILEFMAASANECSVKELAEHFKLPNSHVCRLLKTLVETGYVQQIPGSRKYRISLKILCLSNARLLKLTLRQKARVYMQKLAAELNSSVYLTASFNGLSITIDTFFPETIAGDAGLAVGAVHLPNCHACGKVCAAYLPEAELDGFLAGMDWTARTVHTITSPECFKQELAKIRQEKIATIISENHLGVGAVAAPIFNAVCELAGAVGVVMPVELYWTNDLWEKFKNETRRTAESISFAIGYPLLE
ncbi:MAG: IclR family transcriptional regulator [Victivallaceae bacterium]